MNQFDLHTGLAVFGGEPHVFHCHHYNVFLQRTIEDLPDVDGAAIQAAAAEEVVFGQLKRTLAGDRALDDGAALFQELGFGVLDLTGLSAEGGEVKAPVSHYAQGWVSKFGQHKGPACHFVRGYLAALTAVAFDRPAGSYDVTETACAADGAAVCIFVVTPGTGRDVAPSVGVGRVPSAFEDRPREFGNIDEATIVSTLASMPIVGNEEGMIPAFGVYLTRHYANYYNRISFAFERAVLAKRGEAAGELVETMLVEAGHVCAFNTFGGIMQSAEWEGLIQPMIRTKEDWAYGIVAVVNALGWGRWTIDALEPGKRLEITIEGSYESNGYLAMHGQSDTPKCYLARGGVAGIMNLLYVGDITQKPTLNEAYYQKTFSAETSFIAREVACRAKGDDACRFVAEPVQF